MPVSSYVSELRKHVGQDLLLLPSVTAVVFNDAGEILLGRRTDNGRWALIGGIIDPGEQPADAAVREIREEAGVTAVVERLVGVASRPVHYPNGDQVADVSIWFRCLAVNADAYVADDESLEIGWFRTDELPQLSDWARHLIDLATKDDPAAWFAPPGERIEALESF